MLRDSAWLCQRARVRGALARRGHDHLGEPPREGLSREDASFDSALPHDELSLVF